MKNTLYDPYLYDPDNTYLMITAGLSYSDPSDQQSGREQVSPKVAYEPFIGRNFFQSISSWLYFQLQYHVIAIFIVSALFILWLLVITGVLGQLFH